MNKFKISLCLILLLVGVLSLALPVRAGSWQIESGEFELAKGQVMKGDLFFGGERLVIDGIIQGDLVLFSDEVIINGRVEGSILGVVSGKLTNNGVIEGSVRGFMKEAYLSETGVVNGSITVLAVKLVTARGSIIGRGILGRFSEVDLKGMVTGGASITSGIRTKLGGELNGDISIGGAPVTWAPPLTVNGQVTDSTGTDINPDKIAGIELNGEYRQRKPVNDQIALLKGAVIISFIWFVGTLLASLVLYRFFPRTAWNVSEPSAANFWRSLLMGLIGLLVLPVIIFILAITVVGLPLALLLGIFYLMLLLFSGIPLNLWFGRLVFKSRFNPVLMIVMGGLFLALLKLLPIINLLLNPLLLVLGIGMVIGNIRPQVNQYVKD